MREIGNASGSGGGSKQERITSATQNYLKKARVLIKKLNGELPRFPQEGIADILLIIALEHFVVLLDKYIYLIDRYMLKVAMPHQEKMFSIFETYTKG